MEGILKPYQIMPFARPREKHIIIPFGISVKGLYKLWLIDKITGKLKDYREGENLLTNEYRDYALNDGLEGKYDDIALGDDDTDPSRDDTDIIGNLISDDPDDGSTDTNSGDNPWEVEREWYFSADNANGSIWEIAIGDPCHSRIVLDEAIDKTDTDELWITYTRQVYRGTDFFTGTITDGGRDGTTDIDWSIEIRNEDLKHLAEDGVGYEAQDIRAYNEDDEELFSGPPLEFNTNYNEDDKYVELEYGFETDEAVGQIKRVIPGADVSSPYGDYWSTKFSCEFSPALDKTDNYRLYLTFRGELDNW